VNAAPPLPAKDSNQRRPLVGIGKPVSPNSESSDQQHHVTFSSATATIIPSAGSGSTNSSAQSRTMATPTPDPVFSPSNESHTTENTDIDMEHEGLHLEEPLQPTERDILDILSEVKGRHEKMQEESKDSNGRRVERGIEIDRDGNPFETLRTSLSPVT